MGIWVRSQKRTELIFAKQFNIADCGNPTNYIIEDENGTLLASYNDFGKALKILNEIQKTIIKNGKNITVYEMPEE